MEPDTTFTWICERKNKRMNGTAVRPVVNHGSHVYFFFCNRKRQHIRYTWGHWTPHDSLQTFMAWETFFLSLVTSTKSSADNQTLKQVYIISNVVVSTVPLLVSTLLSVLVGGGWNEFSLFTFLLLSASASRICTNIHSFVWKQPKNEFSLVPVAQ